MAKKTLKRSRKTRRRTVRRRSHKGGADSQALAIPTAGLKVSTGGVNSQDVLTGIAKV